MFEYRFETWELLNQAFLEHSFNAYLLESESSSSLSRQSEYEPNKNQKWDPLRAMKTFIRRKVGHTT